MVITTSSCVFHRSSCFLNHLGALYGAFLGWIFVVMVFNVIMFCSVIFVVIKHMCTRGQLGKEQERMKPAKAIRLIINISGIVFLFGLSWLFAALAINIPEVTTIFQILFTVFTILQGFFIFLFYCVIDRKAIEYWKEFLSCGKYKTNKPYPSHKQTSTGVTGKMTGKTVGSNYSNYYCDSSLKMDTSFGTLTKDSYM